MVVYLMMLRGSLATRGDKSESREENFKFMRHASQPRVYVGMNSSH